MMKRIIALLLALILTVGLLPTVALAAGETANTDVKSGSIGEDGKWTTATPDQTNKPEGVETVSKTAKPTSNPNEYEVELKVVLKQTSETKTVAAATALVLDCSGSMKWCAVCGQEYCYHTTGVTYNPTYTVNDDYYYYVKNDNEYVSVEYCDGKHGWFNQNSCTGGAGWYTEGGRKDHTPNKKFTPMTSVDDTDTAHTQFYTRTGGSSDTSRMTAAKNAAKNFLKTYSGFDANVINDNGTLKDTAKSLSIKRYVAVIRFSNNIDNDTDSSSWWEGEDYKPAWYDVSTVVGYNKVLATINQAWAYGGTNLDAGLTTASSLMDANLVKNLTSKNVIALTDGAPTYSKGYGDGGSTNKDICDETAQTAATLREKSKVYTVCFAAESDPLYNGGDTVGNFLKNRIATQPAEGTTEQYAYNAKSADELIEVFKDITDTIVSGLNTGTVKDTLPTGITSAAFDEGNVKEWKLNEAPFTKNETPNTVGGKQVTTYTYTYTYTVTIDPLTVAKTEIDGAYYAPLNGETTLTVKNGDKNVTIHFPIPAGKVTMPSHTVTWKSQDGNTTLETDNNVEYNTKPSFDRADPTKDADEQYTYTFVGWATEANKETGTLEADLPPVTDDVTYYAAFSKTARTYTVTWMPQDGQGNAYETDTGVAYNASPSYDSEVPTKAADAEHTYTFVGWATSANQETGTLEANLPAVTADVTYYAAFSKTPRTYTVTWMPQDGQGNAYETDTSVAYNARPSYDGTEPTKAADAEHTYTFVGWATTTNQTSGSTVDALPNVTADVTYYAAFSATKQTYTIRFETEAGGTLTGTTECTGLSHGADFPAAPTTTSNVGYYFDGWYKDNTKVTSFPTTVTENATYTAKWLSYNSINLDLTGKIQKTLNSDVALTNEIFTINLTLNGAEVPSATATATVSATTASGTGYTGSAPFQTATDEFKLTFTAPGTYIYSIVEEAPTRSGMTYDVNKYNATGHTMTVVVEEDAAHALSVTRVTVDGTADTDATWLTITNNYVEPKNAQVTNKEVVVTQPEGALKTAVDAFEFTSGVTVLYPTGNGTTSNTLEVPYSTTEATLLYKITVYAGTESSYTFEDKDASFVYAENAKTVTKNGDYFTVTFEDGAEYAYVYVAVTHAISYDADGEYKARNFIGSQGAETTVTEKDPNKLTINFADFVKKELTATGSKTANDVKFRVIVNGMESPYMMYNVGEEEVSTYAAFDPKYSTVLNVNFASITGGNTETEWFIADNSIVIDQAGIYYFELNEEDGKRTGVTYDDSIYKVLVYVERKDDKLVVKSFDIMKDNVYVDGDTITFHNTIDTGKDDYYPIIIPTIINKDTGMLNKTDHFAYVIGYPDGTVHPNGQITRAEVATIFFRLLRDEVRDGAFTTSNSYSDVAYGKWYNNPISTMSALGIITGYPDGTFKPNKPITRAEFAAIAARFDETQSGKSATFSDVIGHWAAKEIGIAYYNDWIKGYPDGTFKPDQNITRAEAMTLINRVLERKPESPADLLTNMNKWTDNLDTSKWYYLDVQEATNSHGYTRKTFNYELWRQMLPDPDWSRYER